MSAGDHSSEEMAPVLTSAADLRKALNNDPRVVLIIGVRVEENGDKTDVYIVFKDDLLDSLSLDDQALLVKSFQIAAEYVLNRSPVGGNEKAN